MEYLIFSPDNVILTHIIRTKFSVNQIRTLDDITCALCENDAERYCKNCKEYLCKACDSDVHDGADDIGGDERRNKMFLLAEKHNVVPLADVKPRFGNCKDHGNRKNEYYDMLRNKACCTMCAIEMSSGKAGNANLVSVENAYSISKNRINNPDSALEQKIQLIKSQKDQI